MSNAFLKRRKITRCDSCKVKKSFNKPGEGWFINPKDTTFIHREGTGSDVLIITDMLEFEDSVDFIINYVKSRGIKNFTLKSAIKCRTKNFALPSPIVDNYKFCNSLEVDDLDYKVYVTLNRALFALTETKDLDSWKDFNEYIFNQTYFIYKNKRVYPIPFVFDWMEKDNFSSYFVREQLKNVKKHLFDYSLEHIKDYNIVDVQDPNEFLKQNMEAKNCAWDLETSSLHHFREDFEVGVMTLSFDGVTAYYLNFKDIDKELLEKFLSNKYSITANGKFDTKSLFVEGVKAHINEDVTLLLHLLNTNRKSNSIKGLAWLIGLGGYDRKLDEYIKKNNITNYLDIPKEFMLPYAGMDAIVTYRLWEFGMKLAKKQPAVYDVYKKVVIPVISVYEKMEINGMHIDTEYMKIFFQDINEKILETEKGIKEILGDFLITSTKQLAKKLELYGFPNLGSSEKEFWVDELGGKHYYFKTGVEILKQYKKINDDPILDLLLYHKSLSKLQSSFVGDFEEKENRLKEKTFLNKITVKEGKGKDKDKKIKGMAQHVIDGVVHASFGPARAGSARSVCGNPNLQNQTKRSILAKELRHIFKCPEDYYIAEFDMSGFQLRIAGILSGDSVMEDVFINKSGDMHSVTAQQIFAPEISLDEFIKNKDVEPYKTYRYKGKNEINFPLIFSDTPYVIYNAIQENWTDDEMYEYIDKNKLEIKISKMGDELPIDTVITDLWEKFFQTYPELRLWIKSQHQTAKRFGYTDNIHGIRRHLPELSYIGNEWDWENGILRNLLNISVNSRVQSFEFIEVAMAMIDIDRKMSRRKTKSVMVNMVHDSLVFYLHKDEIRMMHTLVTNSMNTDKYPIPIVSEMDIGKLWGFGETVENENDLNKFLIKEGING